MRLLAIELRPGKVAPANDLSSGREVLNASDEPGRRAVIPRAPNCEGRNSLPSSLPHANRLKPSIYGLFRWAA